MADPITILSRSPDLQDLLYRTLFEKRGDKPLTEPFHRVLFPEVPDSLLWYPIEITQIFAQLVTCPESLPSRRASKRVQFQWKTLRPCVLAAKARYTGAPANLEEELTMNVLAQKILLRHAKGGKTAEMCLTQLVNLRVIFATSSAITKYMSAIKYCLGNNRSAAYCDNSHKRVADLVMDRCCPLEGNRFLI
ncbi:MAG: hypothetical protein SP1CHLAM54_10890 [Chlamydiia bacterium]|nr:hypothetical protein [Chlamydiia bacterium]MCH9615994.1 hypothetical protein [Chlamydiia bacterium]MCH9629017.1 hypothetical protein [Chlamydiia bacterium]